MEQALALLLTYKYYILMPLSIVEGPIITVIAGFLASTHLINPFLVYGVVVLGDLIGDTGSYLFGRLGSGFVLKYGGIIGVNAERLEFAERYFRSNHKKAVLISKVAYGIGSAGLVAAGVLRISYVRYIRTCFIISLAQSAIFLTIGLLFGNAYKEIGRYLDTFSAGVSTIVLLVIVLLIVFKLKKVLADVLLKWNNKRNQRS